MRLVTLILLAASAAFAGDGFVLVHGSAGWRVDDFEILDHPVTNAEWQGYVAATKVAAPLHWVNGTIPAGMEQHPVIFVNRYDVKRYLAWRAAREKRIYRLPMVAEYD